MTDLQAMNAVYIDTGPKADWRELGTTGDTRSDAETVLSRFFTYAHGRMEWIELSVNWMPFEQVGPRERKFWSKRRLAKAIDQLVEAGLLFDVCGSDCHWGLTAEARRNFTVDGRLGHVSNH